MRPRVISARAVYWIMIALLVIACGDGAVSAPGLVVRRVDSLPSAQYRAVWQSIEQCSGRTRAIAEISSWYLVGRGAVSYRRADGLVVFGEYLPHYGIVLADGVADLDLEIGHEMLHAIRRDVGLAHDSTDFRARCAMLVTLGDAHP